MRRVSLLLAAAALLLALSAGVALAQNFIGTSGPDVLVGTNTADFIDGKGGDDDLYGEDGRDTILGRGGNDLILGGRGPDRLTGGYGNDTIYGGGGNDAVNGGPGDDTIIVGDDANGPQGGRPVCLRTRRRHRLRKLRRQQLTGRRWLRGDDKRGSPTDPTDPSPLGATLREQGRPSPIRARPSLFGAPVLVGTIRRSRTEAGRYGRRSRRGEQWCESSRSSSAPRDPRVAISDYIEHKAAIHWSAWKEYSANFGFTAFREVREESCNN